VSAGFGPDFQEAGSRLYRAEYAAITLAVAGYLLWRTFYAGGVDWLQVVFWAVLPDLAAFVPIGASSQRKGWPSWGPYLYNLFHTPLSWGLVFVVLLAVLREPYWPLLGWLGHITADRAVGYGLRAKAPSARSPP
jgi:hypothetical protein